jgi:hypothetical protein
MKSPVRKIAERSSLAGDAVLRWLQAQGINLVERQYNPETDAEYRASLLTSPVEPGLVPVDGVMILVGERDINREVEILEKKRESKLNR